MESRRIMKIAKAPVLIFTILLLLIEIYQFVTNGLKLLGWLRIIIALFILLITLLISKKYDEKNQRYERLLMEKKQHEDELLIATNHIHEFDQLFHSLAGAIFSYNINNRTTFFSKGIEGLFGYSQDEINKQPHILKKIIFQ